MSGKQSLIAFVGVAMVVANLVLNRTTALSFGQSQATTGSAGILQTLFGPAPGQPQSDATLQLAHSEILGLVAELFVLLVLVIVGGLQSGISNIAVVFTLGLAAVWATVQFGGRTSANTNRAPQAPGAAHAPQTRQQRTP